MTNEEARAVFERLIAAAATDRERDTLRLACEYFTDARFRRALSDYVAVRNGLGGES